MGIMDTLFGMGRSQGQDNPPVNPNVRVDPNDPRITPQERNQALQNRQQGQQQGASNTPAPTAGAMNNQAPTSANGNVPTNQGGQSSPLDDFSKIWETNPDPKVNAQKKFTYPKFDNNKLQERVGQMNFTDHIPQELLGKAASGDAASLAEVLNHVGRRAFQTGFSATNALNSQVFDQFGNSIDERIPQQVRGLQDQQAVMGELKSLNHPAVAPMLETVTKQIRNLYPDASPEEIKNHAKKYMVTMAEIITGRIGTEDSGANNSSEGNSNSQVNRGGITDFSSWQ